MRRAVILGLLFLFCPACLALPKGFYVGGALLRSYSKEADYPPPMSCFTSQTARAQSGFWDGGGSMALHVGHEIFPGWGLQLESGVMRRNGSVYLAYRRQTTGWDKDNRYVDAVIDRGEITSHRFQSDRFLLGARLHPAFPDSLFGPLLGAALAFGWSQRSHTYHSWWDAAYSGGVVHRYNSEERQVSAGTPGWLLEFGFRVRTRGHFAVDLLYQFENLNVALPRGDVVYPLRNAWITTVRLGTYYRF